MGGELPVAPRLGRSLRVDHEIGDVLGVADLVRPQADLVERVVAGGVARGRIEEEDVLPELVRPKAGGGLVELPLHVEDDGGVAVVEQVGDDVADAFAAAGRRDEHHMVRLVVVEADAPAARICVEAEEEALGTGDGAGRGIRRHDSGRLEILEVRPAGGAVDVRLGGEAGELDEEDEAGAGGGQSG